MPPHFVTYCFGKCQNDNLTYSGKLIQRAWSNFRMKVIKRDKINRPNQTCCYCNKSSTERGILFPFSLLHRVKKNTKEVSFLCMKNSVEMGTYILRDISQEFLANFCVQIFLQNSTKVSGSFPSNGSKTSKSSICLHKFPLL